jgi:hypothetical protein
MSALKTTSLNQQEASNIANDILKHMQNWFSRDKAHLTLSDLEPVFTSDFQMFSNGLLVSKNLSNHLDRLNELKKKYSSLTFKGPHEEILVQNDKFSVYYTLCFPPRTGQDKQLEVDFMAIATIKDHKLHRWVQVVHERGKDWYANLR